MKAPRTPPAKLSASMTAESYRVLARAIEQGEVTGAQMSLLRTLMVELAEVADVIEGTRHGH